MKEEGRIDEGRKKGCMDGVEGGMDKRKREDVRENGMKYDK